jgi:hypothetical protein
MQDEILERWLELCRQAATEQDHHRLLEEILRLLTEKERRLTQLAKAGRVVGSSTAQQSP